MNEYRLNLGQPEAQEFLLKQMEEYFFGKGVELSPNSSRKRTLAIVSIRYAARRFPSRAACA